MLGCAPKDTRDNKSMRKKAAGILLYRGKGSTLEVFLDEDPLKAAQREFQEETSFPVQGPFIPIGSVRQSSGKIVQAWATEGDLDASAIQSNSFRLEWPPRSGKYQDFPEADRGEWFSLPQARTKILKVQLSFLDYLEHLLLKR
jgi:predicted NUDIX family NTP pyrophosphohydrolase